MNKEKKSISQKILEDLFETLKDKKEFDDLLRAKLKSLGKADKLSKNKSVEELINPK